MAINRDEETLTAPKAFQPRLPEQPVSAVERLSESFQSLSLIDGNGDLKKDALKKLSSEQIKNLQTSLIEAGFKNIGNADGIAGKKTLAGLEQAIAKTALVKEITSPNASEKDSNRIIQKSLEKLGHDVGRVDGVFGPKTTAALADYINEENLPSAALSATVKEKIAQYNVKLDVKAQTVVPVQGIDPRQAKIDPSITPILGAYEQSETDIAVLQKFLKDNGYDVGKIDGDFGEDTTKQFVKFLEQNPAYHRHMGPNLILETEIYAIENEVSNDLRRSLNLRDLSAMPTPGDDVRYQAYKDYFQSEGKPVDLARGIKVASELTGVPMENLFVVMKQESINFGDYNPVKPGMRGYSSANAMADNYGQFVNGTFHHMNETYGDTARQELGREGIRLEAGKDWRDDPLVAPYMVAKYLKESGSVDDLTKQYPAHVLPVMKQKGDSDAIVATQYPVEARSNRHIFYDGSKPLSFSEAREKIVGTLKDDMVVERDIVISAQRDKLKEEILINQQSQKPYLDDTIQRRNDNFSDLVGGKNSLQEAGAKLSMRGTFNQRAELLQIADLDSPTPSPTKPKGPDVTAQTLG